MDTTAGTCSLCGGRVTLPSAWYGTTPPIPTCESCGATKKSPHGGVIEMEPPRRKSLVEKMEEEADKPVPYEWFYKP